MASVSTPLRPARKKSKKLSKLKSHLSFRALPPLPPPPPPPEIKSLGQVSLSSKSLVILNPDELKSGDDPNDLGVRGHRKVVKLRTSHDCPISASFLRFRFHVNVTKTDENDNENTKCCDNKPERHVQELSLWFDDELDSGAFNNEMCS